MFLQEKLGDICERLKALEQVSDIVVWGAGLHTCKLFEKTNLLSYGVKHVVDMDSRKQGNSYFGFPIKAPEEVDWENVEAVVISVPGKEAQIEKILTEQLGNRGLHVKLYEEWESSPFYRLYDETVSGVRYLGDYDSWDSAKKECRGYGDAAIIDKVSGSIGRVLDGSAAWERDGYLFYKQKYAYQICAAILRCAVQNENQGVRILDIGGALGSTYYQNRNYLKDIKKLEYVIAEQDSFADYGRGKLENDELRFIRSTEDYTEYGSFDIVLMSGSLQYIPCDKEIIRKVRKAEPRYIILDRLLVSDRNRICRETVPKEIYESSYPVRIYREEDVKDFWGTDYQLVEEDISSVPEEACFPDGRAESRFYVFEHTAENIG